MILGLSGVFLPQIAQAKQSVCVMEAEILAKYKLDISAGDKFRY